MEYIHNYCRLFIYIYKEKKKQLILCNVQITGYKIIITDEDMASTRSWNVDSIQVLIGLVTRAHAKKFQNVLNGLIQGIWTQASTWRPIDGDEQNP
jgi:hypothetical protein